MFFDLGNKNYYQPRICTCHSRRETNIEVGNTCASCSNSNNERSSKLQCTRGQLLVLANFTQVQLCKLCYRIRTHRLPFFPTLHHHEHKGRLAVKERQLHKVQLANFHVCTHVLLSLPSNFQSFRFDTHIRQHNLSVYICPFVSSA